MSCRLLAAFVLCYFQSSVLSGATIDDDPEAECRRCCAFNFPVSDLTHNVHFQLLTALYTWVYFSLRNIQFSVMSHLLV